MAVSDTFTLPGQPAAGVGARLVVLNGDGFHSPKQMYELQVSLAGDVSGGNSVITVNMDLRFVNLILRMELVSLAAVAVEEFQLTQTLDQSGINSSIVGKTILNVTSAFNPCSAWWDPPGLLPITQISSTLANTDGLSHIFSAWIYCFDINSLNTVPLPVLTRSIGRTSGQSNPN